MRTDKTILIAGPTASGKSGLAVLLAERLDGEVINADSMQVYAELRVLTARPTVADEARVPHRLYGHVHGEEGYSAGRYVADAATAIAQARAAGKVPIVVGGSGLYFKALLEGLAPIPRVPSEIRVRWRERAEKDGAAPLHRVLAARDPEMASRLAPTDAQRIVRALEVLEATGRSLGDWQREPGVPVLRAVDCDRLVLVPERDDLYERCDRRFDLMMRLGALDEAATLRDLHLDPDLPIMRALGVRPLLAHLAGRQVLADAVAAAKSETRQYAKRQVTWLRGHMMSWMWLSKKQMESIERKDLSFIDFDD